MLTCHSQHYWMQQIQCPVQLGCRLGRGWELNLQRFCQQWCENKVVGLAVRKLVGRAERLYPFFLLSLENAGVVSSRSEFILIKRHGFQIELINFRFFFLFSRMQKWLHSHQKQPCQH
jgi:hypothetical protein